ncbi:MAG: hypothetical protein J6I96_00915 [Oscillospiraceae bacterium]|nr:hypothetical protein [Oscillospiraceae bacterium]
MARRRFVDEDAIREKNNRAANRQGPLKKNASMFVYVVAVLLAVAARIYQLMTNWDFDRARYINSNPLLNFPVMIIIPACAVLAFVLITGSARDKVIKSCVLINPWRLRYDRLSRKIPMSAGYAALAMAMMYLVDIVTFFVSLWHKNEKYAYDNLRVTPENPDIDKYAYKEWNRLTGYTWGTFFYQVLMLLVMIMFISLAVNIFKGEGLTHANCAALTLYSVWQIVNILRMLSSNDAIALSSDRLYELFSRMAAVLFFMAMARLFNGMEKKNTRFWLCFWGYTASILAAVSVIPRYFWLIFPDGKFDLRAGLDVPDATDLGIIFMPICVIGAFWTTYVYRAMPKLSTGKRRWTKAPMTRDYEEMGAIEDENVERHEI